MWFDTITWLLGCPPILHWRRLIFSWHSNIITHFFTDSELIMILYNNEIVRMPSSIILAGAAFRLVPSNFFDSYKNI